MPSRAYLATRSALCSERALHIPINIDPSTAKILRIALNDKIPRMQLHTIPGFFNTHKVVFIKYWVKLNRPGKE